MISRIQQSRFALMLGCFVTLLCSMSVQASETPSKKIPPSVKKFHGDERLAILKQADRIEAFRVDGMVQPKQNTAGGYKILSKGKSLSKQQTQVFQQLLFSEKSYAFEVAKGCEPIPGIVLRVYSKKEFVDVIFCFQCDMWGFQHKGKSKWEDFDPARPKLVNLMKQLFPNDDVVQGLKAKS